MRVTKNTLKQIILESLQEVAPGEVEKMKTAQQTAASQQQKKAMVQGGITDQERAAINNLSQKLAMAAKKGNLLGGTIRKKLELLAAELDKVLKQPQSTTQQGVQE